MVALKLVFVSLLSALVATALPVPQVGPAPADSTDVATEGATEDGTPWSYGWKRQVAPPASDDTTTEGATEDWLLDWKRQVAPAASDDDTATGATEDWKFADWKRQVAPAAGDDDTTTTGASEDAGSFFLPDWKRDDDTPAPVAPAPAPAPAPADDSTTEEGEFHADGAFGWLSIGWKKRDDAVAPVARV